MAVLIDRPEAAAALKRALRLFSREGDFRLEISPQFVPDETKRNRYRRWIGFTLADCGCLVGSLSVLGAIGLFLYYPPFPLFPLWPNLVFYALLLPFIGFIGKGIGLSASFFLGRYLIGRLEAEPFSTVELRGEPAS